MTELLTAHQMHALEKAAIESSAVSGLALMERAGQGVIEAMMAEWPELSQRGHTAVVFCGPGNNGGDGFVIARLLGEAGWNVRVHFAGDRPKRSAEARIMHGKCSAMVEIAPLTVEAVVNGARPDVILDAVFGIGLTRPLSDGLAQALDVKAMHVWKERHKIRRVAVDCPSGLNLDNGMIPTDLQALAATDTVWPAYLNAADLTVTFHSPKPGHYLGLGPTLCGKLAVVDIGLQTDAQERCMVGQPPDAERARLVEPVFMGQPLRPKMWLGAVMGKPGVAGHKYDFGHVAVFAGGVGRGGAARLAARAALRAGAGLVTVICPPAALIENACQLTAIMLRALKPDQPLHEVADDRVNSFCLGPGMGVSARTRALVLETLTRRASERDWRDPVVVLDADALTSFAQDPETLFAQTHARTILTPHDGEFARLFPDLGTSARGDMSKLDAVRLAAERAGCLVLLKGVDTVIAEPGGGASIHAAAYERTAPWLATAGAGDVLAGLIAGLAAAHTSGDLFNVAELAAYLHVELARSFGPGLTAEDLPEEIPKVFRALGL
ncbi:NAD(P)H-hydrate dehydratase [Sulfitobacter sp. F26204]|uniref:NAD(P)H-hydrate dehydratase n=1 Tax=Sulfitobacter sp. F26204 TaxID=2996014 RepID=UPI00225E56CD|nr:NAD(P)H-hydrate dehydratase [Sulfitobacter sp. F26204]MCX7560811.1 NAD(P)H-hydrate dehydratase [Sulfitobacter sp. F26204]